MLTNRLLRSFQPCLKKQVQRIGNKNFRAAVCSMKGLRPAMEDAHAMYLSPDGWAYFGVFDGHGGTLCSKFCAEEILEAVIAAKPPIADPDLQQLILDVDARWLSKQMRSGSTAVMTLLTPAATATLQAQVANVGDSRMLIIPQDELHGTGAFHEMTVDHSPEHERTRIKKAGGFIDAGYVNGRLAMGRAMGNLDLKKGAGPLDHVVIAQADITSREIKVGDYCALFCDGLVEVAKNEHIAAFLKECLEHDASDLGQIVEDLCDVVFCSGSRDNMTAMLVQAVENGEEHQSTEIREYSPEDVREVLTRWGAKVQ
eukprot:TRINITY_DN53229_c1_g1_i1.p1 TRINITY_DN53229_c1_g1~~TRINITY_DN53229_c1_g1_i1.p1  ORF type:complete len:314 (-),score=21.89 TRINITY_DN53229_c1_g1_i1:149-1090(-)